MDSARALLDSLMGSDRHLGKKDPNRKNFWDDDVCKNHLVWECPHSMFVNQAGKIAPNSPLGECRSKHSEAMRTRLKEDKDYETYRRKYLKETKAAYKKLLDELDKKRDRDKEKLTKGVSNTKETQDFVKEQVEKRQNFVKEKLQEADRKAATGELQVTQSVFEEACYLTDEQVRLEKLKETTEKWCDEICELCGAHISWREEEELRHKAEGRPHPHYMGAVCTGWGRVRNSYQKLEKELATVGSKDGLEDDQQGENSRKDADKDGKEINANGSREERRGQSERGQRRDRSRRKDSKDRGGDRSGKKDSRTKGRSRDRSKSRHDRRGRDRDRDRRRDRDRSRDFSRSRRDRSRSRS